MATNFPGSADSFTNPSAGSSLSSPSHADQHTNVNDAVEAIESHLLDGYLYRQTVYFTSSGTFTKASYPWLRAVKVSVIGAGGGSGGVPSTGGTDSGIAGCGGGGAGAERFITDIAGLSASETITVGAGGAGGTSGGGGSTGGSTVAFGMTAAGGAGGEAGVAQSSNTTRNCGNNGSMSGTYDLQKNGGNGTACKMLRAGGSVGSTSGIPGTSFLGGQLAEARDNSGSSAGVIYGEGSRAGVSRANQGQRDGSAGADGIVIVELYA